MLVIKKLSQESYASFADADSLGQFLSAEEIAGVRAGAAVAFVMLIDSRMTGALVMAAAAAGTSPAYLKVYNVTVLEDVRRHGLGRMLMCMAAGEAVERKVWFLGCDAQLSADVQAFADAIHFRAGSDPAVLLLDLSDVEGLRHG